MGFSSVDHDGHQSFSEEWVWIPHLCHSFAGHSAHVRCQQGVGQRRGNGCSRETMVSSFAGPPFDQCAPLPYLGFHLCVAALEKSKFESSSHKRGKISAAQSWLEHDMFEFKTYHLIIGLADFGSRRKETTMQETAMNWALVLLCFPYCKITVMCQQLCCSMV